MATSATVAAALVDRSERGKLALTGAEAQGVPPRPGDQRRRGARARATGCYAAFLTHKGKMLGDLRVLDTGDELLLDTERVALQELFDMIRRCSSAATSSCTSARSSAALLSLIGPEARGLAGAADLPDDRARAPRARDRRRRRCASSPPTSASTSSAPAERHRRGARRAAGARAPWRSTRPPPRSLRVERGRPRYGVDLDDTVDPPGGRAQRARRRVHEGLLRRPGDRRAAALPRQAEPPPARAAAARARAEPATRCASASARSGGWAASSSPPPRPDRAGARAPRGRARRDARGRRRRRDRRGRRAAVRPAPAA